jgi:hypothetical protein
MESADDDSKGYETSRFKLHTTGRGKAKNMDFGAV